MGVMKMIIARTGGVMIQTSAKATRAGYQQRNLSIADGNVRNAEIEAEIRRTQDELDVIAAALPHTIAQTITKHYPSHHHG